MNSRTTRWDENKTLGTLLLVLGVALGCSSEGGAGDDDAPGAGGDETGGVGGTSTGGTISGGSGTSTGGTAAGATSGSGGTSSGTGGAAGAAGMPSSGAAGTGGRGGEGGAAGLGVAGASGAGGASGRAGASGAAGVSGASGASGAAGAPGTSIYGEPCDDEGDSCGRLGVSCLEVSFGGGAINALTCSNTCPGGVDECDDPPVGSGMAVACLPFTTADRCVLVCNVNGTEYPCPTGMSCVGDGGSPVRLCVWL